MGILEEILVAAGSSALGGVGVFYALRQRVIDLEGMCMRRFKKLEEETVSVGSHAQCSQSTSKALDALYGTLDRLMNNQLELMSGVAALKEGQSLVKEELAFMRSYLMGHKGNQ